MNTFLTQAQVEIESEDFQAEAKLALQFVTKLAKVIFLVLIGLGLSTYIAGIRGRRFVSYLYNFYVPKSTSEYITLIFEDKIKVAEVLMQIKYYQVHSILFIKYTYSQLLKILQPVISFVTGLKNGKSTPNKSIE